MKRTDYQTTFLKLETRRSTYGLDGIDKSTLTVGQLKELLENYDDNTPICFSNDSGYTYGELYENDIEEESIVNTDKATKDFNKFLLEYCDKDIGNLLKAFMFIDSDWIKPIHKFRDWFNFMLNEEDRKDIKESYEQDTECEFNFDEIEKNYTHFETSPTWFNAFNSNNQNCDFEQFSDMLERYIDNYDDDELLRFYCRFENKVRELEKESQDQTMSKYLIGKGNARQQAKDWQLWASEQSLSYGELAYYSNHFEKLGKRYGLIKEFKENGILQEVIWKSNY